MIELQSVTKTFQPRRGDPIHALQDVSLRIEQGEFVSLIGASGCGKSTLLRLVDGLTTPTAGRVLVDGRPVTAPHPDMALVFQAATMLPWATILDNVLFPLRLQNRCTHAAIALAHDLLARTGLQGFEQRRPDELSGGMQQRAAICRALVQRPRVLLMDEPFGALDALTREELSLELLGIWSGTGMTVLFVTHSIAEAALLSDRVVVLSPRPGRIAATVPIALPRPRSFAQEALPAFQSAAQQLRSLIFTRPLAA